MKNNFAVQHCKMSSVLYALTLESQSCKCPNSVLYILGDNRVLEFLLRLHYVGMRSVFYAPVTTTTIVSCRVYEMRNDSGVQAEGRKDVLGQDDGNNVQLMLTICLAMTPYEQKYVFSACLINGTVFVNER